MKILAVIPARAGSKGIPNKNIRIINGKPLITYCIETAIESEFITDIVITTDSPEVETIANFYGIDCRHRDAELCGDAVTLDAVIYDVRKEREADYIITLQPTSPTLKRTTLDKAIRYAMEKQLDTLISVVNRPHLAWVECNGKIIPDYEKRLNRQYLPKRYIETGAFVISKASIVTRETRIGKKVGVYEIGEDEAIDVDNFHELLSAEQILREQHTAIIVNGNNEIGLGHVCRMLELADLFFYKPDIYYDRNITKEEVFGNTTHTLIPYWDNNDLISKLNQAHYQIIINDILDTSVSYMKQIKDTMPCSKIINFEDLGEGRKYADVVINALYSNDESESNVYYGENYYLVPKMFLLYKTYKIRENVQNVLVCFGGADPHGYTEKILNLIKKKMYKEINFVIVLGKAKKNAELLLNDKFPKNITILYDVKNMPEIMVKSDLAITSRGRTCFELAVLGVPTIAVAQNEREEKHNFVCEENGFCYLGRDVEEEVLETNFQKLVFSSAFERESMQKKMLAHNLKNGRERIKNLINLR